MRVAVVTEPVAVLAEDDMQVSAPQDTRVSVPEAMRAELVMATVELELAMVLAAIARASMHLESRADATAATAATGKAITHREPRRGIRFIVLLRVRKAEALPDSLPDRQSILAATTFHEINRLLDLRANLAFSNALAQLQKVQPDPATLGLGRIQHTHTGSTRKQRNDCVTGRAKHPGGTTQNVIITITGVIVIIMITIGGIVIATLSFLSVEVFGDGMTDGGIRPGAMTHIIPTTITMVTSMGTMDFNRTR